MAKESVLKSLKKKIVVKIGEGFFPKEFFKNSVGEIIAKGGAFGKGTHGKGFRVMVEHPDPNPFKEFLIGLGIDYAASKFGESRWFDFDETIKHFKTVVLEYRRLGNITTEQFLDRLSDLQGRKITSEEIDATARVDEEVVAIAKRLKPKYSVQ